ncbi:MAG: hypothetical protein F6K50_24535 [Moorea sp. SIO3I7]|nr:hypothetical protein [Moorena sp. SIO3I7]
MKNNINNQLHTQSKLEETLLFTELTPEEAMMINGGFIKKAWRKVKKNAKKILIIGAAVTGAVVAVTTGGSSPPIVQNPVSCWKPEYDPNSGTWHYVPCQGRR